MKDDVPPHFTEAAKEYRAKRPKQAKTNKRPKMDASELNIGLALRNEPGLFAGDLFRFDTFSGQILVMHPIPVSGIATPEYWDPCLRQDIHVIHLMMWLQFNNFTKVTETRVRHAIDVEAHRNEFSSAKEALEAFPLWDGRVRLDHFWIEVCGATVKEDGASEAEILQRVRYLHATARCFWIGLVARIMDPGCKNDNMPILEGPQGTLKSTLLRIITLRPEWFSDSMPHDLSTKDAKAHLAGNLIIEMGELNQMSRTQAGALKDFLTVQIDKYRPAYGRDPIRSKRQCVFVGTTNKSGYFRDETGNRRFWPIPCNRIDLNLAKTQMPQLYAEALAAWNTREQFFLPPEIEDIAGLEQDQRLLEDFWEEGVKTVVDAARAAARRNGTGVFFVTSVSAMEAIDAEKHRWDEGKHNRIARILKKLGGKYKRLPRMGGEQKWGYCFVTGANGGFDPSHPSHQSQAKPLN